MSTLPKPVAWIDNDGCVVRDEFKPNMPVLNWGWRPLFTAAQVAELVDDVIDRIQRGDHDGGIDCYGGSALAEEFRRAYIRQT